MPKFTQHIPSFVDTDGVPHSTTFETMEELLSLPAMQMYGKGENFSHFAISGNCLMEIRRDGFYWWVVGYIDDASSLDLPKWCGGKYKAKMPDGSVKVLSKEVVSSCGGILTLRDGTKAINVGA